LAASGILGLLSLVINDIARPSLLKVTNPLGEGPNISVVSPVVTIVLLKLTNRHVPYSSSAARAEADTNSTKSNPMRSDIAFLGVMVVSSSLFTFGLLM
jgi:hypothetical protein